MWPNGNSLTVMWGAAMFLQHKLAIGSLPSRKCSDGCCHVIGWLHSCSAVSPLPPLVFFFFFLLGPCGLCPPIYFWPLTALREKKQSYTRWRVQGRRPPFNDCILEWKKKRKWKKRLENLERKKNKTQVVLSSPALQVSHWNVSRSDDVVTFPPVMTSQY